MDFDTKMIVNSKNTTRSIVMISLIGGVGIIIPFLSIFVATLRGMTELSMFNSSTLLILSVLLIIFLITRSASATFDGNSKLTMFGIVFIVANVISLIYNLTIYLVL